MKHEHYIITAAASILEARKDRSTWAKAVTVDALELLDNIDEAIKAMRQKYREADEGSAPHVWDMLNSREQLNAAMLNGARDWNQYSWGGCALVYDSDIAKHYCTPSELKKTRGGDRRPNSREEWLDVQARALSQAAARVKGAIKSATLKTYTCPDNNTWGHE